MGNRTGEQNKQIRTADLLVQPGPHLCKYLCLICMLFADFLVLPYHTVMSPDDHNTHVLYPPCLCPYLFFE